MKLKHYKQWKTTSLGMIIILSSIASVFIKEIQWADASIGIAVGLMLIFSPDTIIDKITSLIKLLILCSLVSCVNQKKIAKICADKFPIKDSTVIIEKIDTSYLYIDGDTISIPFYLDGKVIYKDTICPIVKCPQVKITKEKIIYQENTAKQYINESYIKDIIQKNKKLNDDIIRIKTQRNFIIGCLVILLAVSLIMTYLKRWM